MNYIIDKLSDTFYRKLIIILTIIVPLFSFCQPLFSFGQTKNLTSCDLGIAVYYYLLCGYLKRNPNNFFERHANSIFWVSSLLTVLLKIMLDLNPLTVRGIGRLEGRSSVFAIITAISLFYIFKNLKIKQSTLINVVAKGTLGVYLFHESEFLYESLWNKLLNLDAYFKNSANYILVYICSVLLIYFVATVIDLIRLNLLEKPLFSIKLPLLERLFNKFDSYIKSEWFKSWITIELTFTKKTSEVAIISAIYHTLLISHIRFLINNWNGIKHEENGRKAVHFRKIFG